jgi:hypothetical protein
MGTAWGGIIDMVIRYVGIVFESSSIQINWPSPCKNKVKIVQQKNVK